MTRSILVVDDQADLRMLVRLTFSGMGYEVREAGDGEAALAACSAQTPDAMLLDVMLPGIDGYEVCRRLRADPRFAGIRIVLMTAGDQATERAKAQAAGADEYVPKPFSPTKLLDIVSAQLAHPRG